MGIPHNLLKHIPEKELLNLPYFKNRGKHFITRTMIDDQQSIDELYFSDVIKHFHELHDNALNDVVGSDPVALEAAFTLFQWLTTNVGFSVLTTALEGRGAKNKSNKQNFLWPVYS